MGRAAAGEDARARCLLRSIGTVLRSIEPMDPAWEIRAHELARLVELAAEADPGQPLSALISAQRRADLHIVGE